MKIALLAVLCLAVAGCSQTTAGPGAGETAARSEDACEEAIEAQTNAAMLGSALGMVGSLGVIGGRSGVVASQVASTAGNMVATSQSAKARAEVMKECQ